MPGGTFDPVVRNRQSKEANSPIPKKEILRKML